MYNMTLQQQYNGLDAEDTVCLNPDFAVKCDAIHGGDDELATAKTCCTPGDFTSATVFMLSGCKVDVSISVPLLC